MCVRERICVGGCRCWRGGERVDTVRVCLSQERFILSGKPQLFTSSNTSGTKHTHTPTRTHAQHTHTRTHITHIRTHTRTSRGMPENSGLQPQKGTYVVEVAPGLDVAQVHCDVSNAKKRLVMSY